MTLREMWGRITRTKYTGALEREVARLRVENRALLNSILGIAGVPPIVVPADDPAAQAAIELNAAKSAAERKLPADMERGAEKPASSAGTTAGGAKRSANRASAARGTKSVAAPMRRRSWHQIYRILEIDAARKKPAV